MSIIPACEIAEAGGFDRNCYCDDCREMAPFILTEERVVKQISEMLRAEMHRYDAMVKATTEQDAARWNLAVALAFQTAAKMVEGGEYKKAKNDAGP